MDIYIVNYCKRCRAEARMKTEIREKEDAGSMEAWSYAQYAGETERERNTENSILKNNALTQRSLQCVCSMHTFYTSPLED